MSQFKFKKKYGQNFLQDEQTLEKIVSSIEPSPSDLILEIGPGAGAITKKLKRYASQLVAFEIDEETKKYLLSIQDENTEIIYEDFLNIDLTEFLKKYHYEKLYIIGNLPYYITTPIIEHIIDSKVDHQSLTIMVQKEVANRFLATPGHREYGYMTVLLNYYYMIERVIDVKKTQFYPVPKVDSTVLKLTMKKSRDVDIDKLKTLLKDSFRYKRKNIQNNLRAYDRNKLETILHNHGYSLTDRAEELTLETFMDLLKILD